MRYLHHDGLRGAKTELDWLLSGAASCVTVEGPYPGSGLDEPSVAEQIFDPCLLLGGGRRTLPDQIQHFSCHCYTRIDRPAVDFEIQLRGAGREIRVTLGKLGAEFIRLTGNEVESGIDFGDQTEQPLVIMNACGTSVLSAISSVSFPALFLVQNRNRGFIGPEIAIPDDVASTFSRTLYEELLINSRPVGEAVRHARLNLLERYGNPLGLAYSLYADPDLRVEPVVAV